LHTIKQPPGKGLEMTIPRWKQPDWNAQVSDWIHQQLAQRGLTVVGPIEQPHMRPWSTVLVAPTEQGKLYFKACAEPLIHEARLTQLLSTWRPDCTPQVLALEVERGWFLMPDGGLRLREVLQEEKNILRWLELLPLYADLQIELVGRLPEILVCGTPDRRLENLPDLYIRLLERDDLLRIDQTDGLSTAEYHRLQELKAHLAAQSSRLAGMPVPHSLHHGDFHDGNIFLESERYVFFDWGDSSVTHPFFSIRTVSVSLEYSLGIEEDSPEFERLLMAYLEPWQRYAPQAELLEVFRLASRLSPLCSALSWAHSLSWLEPSERQDYQHAVPDLLKEYLSLVERDQGGEH
jgi:hypothetical protein